MLNVARRIEQCRRKLAGCVSLARDCSRNSWQEPAADRRAYRTIKRGAMQDARYWRAEMLEALESGPPRA